ncbi:D-threitol dehydrogenase [compost metagenome]|jgi:NAD(P)-dependent dehydrogenase (short-subunit alcohol dehydrogenase family)|uniref:SDR family NAD(P)-dependent oxidoreductase n=2 Tax=Pseudomonadota TaxID=1224 RepID=UPI00286A5603|nr:SDR family oxidoreductase [Sphingomonas sp. BE270]
MPPASPSLEAPASKPQSSGSWLGLEGHTCVVTGAGSGIGAGIARAFAAIGANVALVDLNLEAAQALAKELRAQGAVAKAIGCDVANEQSVNDAAAATRDALGPISVLVNNAGLLRAGSLDTVSIEDWNLSIAVNLTGYLLCARAFGRDMLEANKGSIVHVASIAALNPQTGSGSYSPSKAGVLLLSRQLASEWGPRGVRSNAILPGMIRTALSAKFYEEPGFEARRSAATASRRIGEPDDLAGSALFLASDRASYVNGAEILVDGGLDCMLMDMVPRPGFNATPAA